MHQAYRGHDIFVQELSPKSAVIFERRTGAELPTKITALPGESDAACLRRACDLIDVYLDARADSAPGLGLGLRLSTG